MFPIVICDEHQDSNEAQDEIVQLLGKQGALLRVFGDPMQTIPGGQGQNDIAAAASTRWDALKNQAAFGELETPHRWRTTNPDLGEWTLSIRKTLKNEQPIDLKGRLPRGVNVKFAENESPTPAKYRLAPENWNDLNALLNEEKRMLLIAASNATIQSLRGTFRPRFSIWEGHTRNYLEKFIDALNDGASNLDTKASAFVDCLKSLLVGFSGGKYGDRLIQEVRAPSDNPRGQIPPQLKVMAESIRADPNHIGFSKAAEHLKGLIVQNADGFSALHIDYRRELDDLTKLKGYNDLLAGFAEISQRRSRAYPKPPRKALSTVHKSKGLEAEFVFVFACDGGHFTETHVKRNLLYVALRACAKITSPFLGLTVSLSGRCFYL
jgi:DNA helicase-2/ATP-dependent DNA helicase PcrA